MNRAPHQRTRHHAEGSPRSRILAMHEKRRAERLRTPCEAAQTHSLRIQNHRGTPNHALGSQADTARATQSA